jgi:hypothetical protein
MLHFEVVLLILPKYGVFFNCEVYLELVPPIKQASLNILAIDWCFGGGGGCFGGGHSTLVYT